MCLLACPHGKSCWFHFTLDLVLASLCACYFAIVKPFGWDWPSKLEVNGYFASAYYHKSVQKSLGVYKLNYWPPEPHHVTAVFHQSKAESRNLARPARFVSQSIQTKPKYSCRCESNTTRSKKAVLPSVLKDCIYLMCFHSAAISIQDIIRLSLSAHHVEMHAFIPTA